MADLHTYAKLPSDPCLTQEQVTAYLDGKLSAADQHACEKHMADCAMCEDALEGLALVKDRSVLALPLINETVVPTESKIIPLHQPNRKKMWYAVAAVMILVLGSTYLIKIMGDNGPDGFAQAESEDVNTDSMSAAPGEGYASLESESKNDSGEYTVTTIDANGTSDLRQENEKPSAQKALGRAEDVLNDGSVVPDQTINNEVVSQPEENRNIVYDEVGDQDIVLSEKVEVIDTKQNAEELAKEEKKPGFFDRAKFDIPTPSKKTEVSKNTEQQTLVTSGTIAGNSGAAGDSRDDNKDKDANVPADGPKTVAPVPSSPQVDNVQTVTQTNNSYDPYTDSGVVYARTVSASDTTAVDQMEMSYINGVNLLAAGQTNAAITMFDKVLLDKNHPRYEDAEFQKAKALIKANKKEEARVLLKTIETKKGKHASEATELLKTL